MDAPRSSGSLKEGGGETNFELFAAPTPRVMENHCHVSNYQLISIIIEEHSFLQNRLKRGLFAMNCLNRGERCVSMISQ
jgi:hypothetical protein